MLIIFYLFLNLFLFNYTNAETNIIAKQEQKIELFSNRDNQENVPFEFEDEIPTPTYEKPSELIVLIRKFGIKFLCVIFDGKDWLLNKYKNSIEEIKVIKHTI